MERKKEIHPLGRTNIRTDTPQNGQPEGHKRKKHGQTEGQREIRTTIV